MGAETSPPAAKSFAPREVRAPLQLRVDYKRMNMFFADYTKNISKGGTFIKTSTPLPVGTRFLFTLSIPSFGAPVELNGEVTWNVDEEDARTSSADPGMGIRFLFGTPGEKSEFETRVEKLMKDNLGEDIYRQLLGKTA